MGGYLYDDSIKSEVILAYLRQEVDELEETMHPADTSEKFNQVEELGDVLCCIIAYAAKNNIDINQALSLNICKIKDRIKIEKRNLVR